MDFDEFKEQINVLTQREDALATKSVTSQENVNIPFAPTDITDTTASDNNTNASEKDTKATKTAHFDLDEELKKSVYATSALSEWIALHMLSGETEIYLGDFPESADSENISSALLEAYIQNPLIGIMDSADYD